MTSRAKAMAQRVMANPEREMCAPGAIEPTAFASVVTLFMLTS
jgi:hypothetical protein